MTRATLLNVENVENSVEYTIGYELGRLTAWADLPYDPKHSPDCQRGYADGYEQGKKEHV